MIGLLQREVPRLLTHPGLSLTVVVAIAMLEQRPRLWFTVAADEIKTAPRATEGGPPGGRAFRQPTPRPG